MAAVINTSDDLLRLLAENAEFYQAARRLILTDELIELPERFARFADRVEAFIARQETFNDRVETFITEQRQFNRRIETSIGELKGSAARRARRNAELLERLTGRPAHAVIASVHNVDSVETQVDAGAIHWYALDPKDFTPA